MPAPVSQFYDSIAAAYDTAMAKSFIGRLLSQRFQDCLLTQFEGAARLLDIGCGSGTDALFLGGKGLQVYGFDVSTGMVEVARQKAAATGLAAKVHFSVGDATDSSTWPDGHFDGAYANFNVLNHLPDLGEFAVALSEKLQPGAFLVVTMMNRVCLSEVLGYLLQLKFATATRKFWSRQNTLALPMRLFFPSEAAGQLAPSFLLQEVVCLGLLVPPAQLYEGRYSRRFFEELATWEQFLFKCRPLQRLCDQYILILKRS